MRRIRPTGRASSPTSVALVNPIRDVRARARVSTIDLRASRSPRRRPGSPFVGSRTSTWSGTITQIIPGNRVLLAAGTAQVLPGTLDTAFADIARRPHRAGRHDRPRQQRRAVHLHRPERAEQPAVLLLGHRVRRELAGVGSLEPRVRPGHQGRSPRCRTESNQHGREQPRDARDRARRGHGHRHQLGADDRRHHRQVQRPVPGG